jgi:hypothetical protein
MPTLSIKPAPISKRSVIVMSWPYKASWDLLNSLNSGCYLSGQDSHPQATSTILLFCLSKLFEYKLGATALDSLRGKFADVECNVQKGTAILTLKTEPTFSAVRKVVTVVSKNFTPEKLMPLFKKYAQLLGVKPEAAHFAHAVGEMAKGAKTLQCFVTGKVTVPDGGEKVLKGALDLIKPAVPSGGKAPQELKSDATPVTWDEFVIPGRLDAFLVQQLLSTMQVESHVRDGNLIPITGSSKWDTVKGKVDKDRIERFVEQKLVKLGPKLPDVLRFLCASSGYFSAGELEKLPAKYDKAGLTALVKKHF